MVSASSMAIRGSAPSRGVLPNAEALVEARDGDEDVDGEQAVVHRNDLRRVPRPDSARGGQA